MRHIPGAGLVLTAALAASALAAGCGGDDDSSGDTGTEGSAPTTTAEASSGGTGDCVESWNAEADDTLKGLASLSNDPNAEVDVGPYAGEPFSAEAFDGTTTGTGQEVAVEAGDCVVSEFSQDFGQPLFVFVLASVDGGAASWHRLSETGKHPLSGSAADLIDPLQTATVDENGDLVPSGG